MGRLDLHESRGQRREESPGRHYGADLREIESHIDMSLPPSEVSEIFPRCGLVDGVNNMMDRTFADSDFSWNWESFPLPPENEPLLHDEKWTS